MPAPLAWGSQQDHSASGTLGMGSCPQPPCCGHSLCAKSDPRDTGVVGGSHTLWGRAFFAPQTLGWGVRWLWCQLPQPPLPSNSSMEIHWDCF